MDNTTYSSEDLRGMLDTYSPDQQMEIDAKTVSESAKTLAAVSAQFKEYMENLPPLVVSLQKAASLRISEESKAEIIQAGKDAGISAQRDAKRVSIPATMAYCLFYIFIVLITFTAVTLLINGFVWHNEFIWKLAFILLGCMTPVMALTIFICYKGWL